MHRRRRDRRTCARSSPTTTGLGGRRWTTSRWLDGGDAFIWISERDGWRTSTRVPRDGGEPRPAHARRVRRHRASTASTRRAAGSTSSPRPTTPTQRYLYRAARRQGKPERVDARDQPGSHTYDISPDGSWAIHTLFVVRHPAASPTSSGCPAHKSVRVLADNAALRAKVDAAARDAGRVLPRGHRRRRHSSTAGASSRPTSIRPGSIRCSSTCTASRPARRSDRWGGNTYLWHLMLDAAGLHRGERRQPRHAGAARPRLAQERLPADRRPRLRGPGRGRRAALADAGRTSDPDASASGAGAAAAR